MAQPVSAANALPKKMRENSIAERRRLPADRRTHPAKGRISISSSAGESESASARWLPWPGMELALWLGNWILSVTLAAPAPAGTIFGVSAAVAPVGNPVTVNATAAGKVVPAVGPTTRA